MTFPRPLLALLLALLLGLGLAAPARAEGRAQLRNDSSHNVGVFLHFKKDPADSPLPFTVLAPGHETDDDFDLVGLYIPAEVALRWEAGGAPAARAPRIARIPAGQQLRLSDPLANPSADGAAAPADDAATYRLNQPQPDLLAGAAAADLKAELPNISQVDLDAQPETAPTD